MSLSPGPFRLLESTVLGLTQPQSDLLKFTDDSLSDLDADLGSLTSQLLSVELESSGPADPLAGVDLAGMFDSLAAAPFDNLDGNAGTMAAGIADSDQISGAADIIAPSECWLNQPPPFDPNADPSVNLNYGLGAGQGGPPAPGTTPAEGQQFNTLPTSPLYQFFLQNLTQYGAGEFSVGDQFKLSLDGPPLVQLHVQAWFQGTNLGDVPMGQTDQTGHFELIGNMRPDMIGAWSEAWYGNDVLIQQVAFFVVTAD